MHMVAGEIPRHSGKLKKIQHRVTLLSDRATTLGKAGNFLALPSALHLRTRQRIFKKKLFAECPTGGASARQTFF